MLYKQKKKELPKKVIPVDMEKIQQRKIQKEKTIEEILAEEEIQQTEQKALKRVFELFVGEKKIKENEKKKKQDEEEVLTFNKADVARVLKMLDYNISSKKIELMIWEVDNNLDQKVDYKEFEFMYKRNICDKNGQEPKSLFNVVQFLMYCKDGQFKITVEDTLELLYVRVGRPHLDQEIRALFGEDEKNENGQEKQITFSEYLEKINKKDVEKRKERQKEIQLLSKLKAKKNDTNIEKY